MSHTHTATKIILSCSLRTCTCDAGYRTGSFLSYCRAGWKSKGGAAGAKYAAAATLSPHILYCTSEDMHMFVCSTIHIWVVPAAYLPVVGVGRIQARV